MPNEEDLVRRLVLDDGTVLDKSECGYAEKKLWCFLKDLSLIEAFSIFSDPEKIKTIKFEIGISSRYTRYTYTGFVNLETAMKRELEIDVCVTGDNTEIHQEEVIS